MRTYIRKLLCFVLILCLLLSCLPAVSAAEGFMAANPTIRLHISELDIAERETPPDAAFVLGEENTALGRCAQAFIEENNIPSDVVLQPLAHPYGSMENVLSACVWDRSEADCGIVLACDAIMFQQPLLSVPDPAAEGENLYCFIPGAPAEKAAMEAFVQYLNDHGTEEVFSAHGLYPLPTV